MVAEYVLLHLRCQFIVSKRHPHLAKMLKKIPYQIGQCFVFKHFILVSPCSKPQVNLSHQLVRRIIGAYVLYARPFYTYSYAFIAYKCPTSNPHMHVRACVRSYIRTARGSCWTRLGLIERWS